MQEMVFMPERLAERRKAYHYSQRELAEAAGVTASYIASLEIGASKSPGYIDIAKVANVLETEPSFFFGPAARDHEQASGGAA